MSSTMLEFYLKQNITTEHVDFENQNEYFRKRKNLYRQLGVPMLAIKGSDILEVGPGPGHNSIPLIIWGGGQEVLIWLNPIRWR